MTWSLAAWLVAVGLVLYGLHRGALWMERRGWIYYRDQRASTSSASNAFMQVQAIFEPRAEHVVEARRSDDARAAEDAGAGGPAQED
jgi:hypothetical protein